MKPELTDLPATRLWGAIGISVLMNGLLWRAFGSAIMSQQAPPPRTIEISRVVLSKVGRTVPKIVTKKQIQKRVERIHRQIERPKPKVPIKPLSRPTAPPIERVRPRKPVVRPPIPRNVPQVPDSDKKPPKSPATNLQGAHHRTLVAPQKAAPDAGNVKTGGHAELGKPTDKQNYGEKTTTPKNFATPAPQPQPTVAPAPADTPVPPPVATATPRPTATPLPTATPRPTSTPTPQPTNTPTPRPEPTNTPRPEPTDTPRPTPTPQPTNTPKPRGITREAIPVRQPQPDIPDDLKGASFKTSVRVSVAVDADGNSSPTLRGTSGNAQIDALVLAALRRWKWKPALDNGMPVASSQRFRFDFEVR